MELRPLGNSGLLVSTVGLGANAFGFRPDVDADRVIGEAVDCGITLFDTANVYGDGESEKALGKALRGKRHKVVIATKWGIPMGLPPGVNIGDTPIRRGARSFILNSLEESLQRLGTDYIDLFQMHFPDPDTPIEETLATLTELVRAGKIRYIGLSNTAAWQLVEANATARHRGFEPFISMQSEYSLLRRDVLEPELATVCSRYGAGVIAFFPLASGMLTGKHSRSGFVAGTRMADNAHFAHRFGSAHHWDMVDRLDTFARERGFSLLDLAMSWPLAKQPVASVIAGATSAEQVRANCLAAARWRMSAEDLAAIDDITGVPTGIILHE